MDISGGSRQQIAQMRQIIVAMDGVVRTTPLRLPGDRFSLAVAGGLDADALAGAIQQRGGDLLEAVRVFERVIYVRFKNVDGEAQAPAQGNRPLARRGAR